jgi:ATP synthase protein I
LGTWYVPRAAEEHLQKYSESLRKIAPYLNIGGVFAGCLVIGVFLGHWLDGKWGTKPWLLLAGALLGMVSGFYHFFKTVLQLDKNSTKKKDSDDDEQ